MALYQSGDRKQCSKCGLIKNTSEFGKLPPRKNGGVHTLASKCNDCRSSAQLETLRIKDEKRDLNQVKKPRKRVFGDWYDKF